MTQTFVMSYTMEKNIRHKKQVAESQRIKAQEIPWAFLIGGIKVKADERLISLAMQKMKIYIHLTRNSNVTIQLLFTGSIPTAERTLVKVFLLW